MSALRQLVQAHSEQLITRDEYLHIRTLLLNKLEQTGNVHESDLENFLNLKHVSSSNSDAPRYDFSDILIATLGLCAASILAFILYS